MSISDIIGYQTSSTLAWWQIKKSATHAADFKKYMQVEFMVPNVHKNAETESLRGYAARR